MAPPNNVPDASRLPDVHFNDPEILRACGPGPDDVAALLTRFKQPAPSRNAIQQWASRAYIPERWRGVIVYALLASSQITTKNLFRRGPARPSQRVVTRRRKPRRVEA